MTTKYKHDWETRSVGLYDTVHMCSRCEKMHIMSIDNVLSNLPTYGCKKPLEYSAALKDHEIARMVNKLTQVAKDYCHAQCLRGQLRKVVLNYLKPDEPK